MEKKSDSKVSEVKSENKKLSYEELEKIASNLNNQCKQLYQELMETRQVLANFNDVGLLLSIIDKSEYFDTSFVERCIKKVQTIITEMMDNADKAKE